MHHRWAVTAVALAMGCGASPATVHDAGAIAVDAGAITGDAGRDAGAPAHQIAYVSGNGPDILRFDVGQNGALSPLGATPAFAANPSFLAITASAVYAVSEATGRVGAYARSQDSGALTLINDASSGGAGPAHVAVDRGGGYVLVANYSDGAVSTLAIRSDGGLAAPRTIQAGKNAHMIVTDPSNRYAFVPCLGDNYVAQYRFDAATGQLTPNATPHLATAAGAGPRHLAFAPDGVHAYLINEIASTLSALALDTATGQLRELQTVSTRAAGATGTNTGAEVWVHPSGRFVYASNRGDNTIAVFAIAGDGRITPVGQAQTGGQTPRSFAIDATGAWLYVANQGTSTVVPFAIDPRTGMPSPTASAVTATSPEFVALVAAPR